jgi:hypothetical protein
VLRPRRRRPRAGRIRARRRPRDTARRRSVTSAASEGNNGVQTGVVVVQTSTSPPALGIAVVLLVAGLTTGAPERGTPVRRLGTHPPAQPHRRGRLRPRESRLRSRRASTTPPLRRLAVGHPSGELGTGCQGHASARARITTRRRGPRTSNDGSRSSVYRT